mgnify:CR=1 FL=1
MLVLSILCYVLISNIKKRITKDSNVSSFHLGTIELSQRRLQIPKGLLFQDKEEGTLTQEPTTHPPIPLDFSNFVIQPDSGLRLSQRRQDYF